MSGGVLEENPTRVKKENISQCSYFLSVSQLKNKKFHFSASLLSTDIAD